MPISSANPRLRVLILMRHATRAGGLDTLAAEGHKQAEKLPELLATRLKKLARLAQQDSPQQLPADLMAANANELLWNIHASPKVRTQQTLRFLNELLRANRNVEKSEILELLDERLADESQTEFEARVRNLLDAWHADVASDSVGEIRVACSHLDWLEAAAVFLASDESDAERSAPWPPLETRLYFFKNGIWNRFRY